MTRLKPGDRVDCRIKLNTIISAYNPDYDEVKTFEIVAQDKSGYYVFVPRYLFLKGSVTADKYLCKQLNINLRFTDEQIIFVQETAIYKINSILDGCYCTRCNDFYYRTDPNQDDGSFICWSCRDDPYR